MIGIAGLALLFFGVALLAMAYNRRRWRRMNKMFCYFEYEYNGELGTSRDYGPMEEIDAVGAMQYRRAMGAEITFQDFSTDKDYIHEVIDERQYFHDKRKQRKKYA